MSNYSDQTKEELLELAKERDIQGRSGMNKAELVEALTESDEVEDKEVATPKEAPKKEEAPEVVPTPNNNKYEPPLIEQFEKRREAYGKLLRLAPNPVKVKREEPVAPPNRIIYPANRVLDTTGLGGPESGTWEGSYDAPEIKKERYKETFSADTPLGKEVLKAEQERERKSSYGE